MASNITAPINYSVVANGQFVSGGSVAFGAPSVKPDPTNPATLKAIYTDSGLTIQAENPQPLDSNGVFDQTTNGVLYGVDSDQYSLTIYDRNGAELSYIPIYDLSDATAATTAQQAAADAQAAESGAQLAESGAQASEASTLLLYTDFVNRYFGSFADDPAVDDEGNAPNEGSLYWNSSSSRFKVYSSGAWIFPEDLALGTAAYADTGVDPDEVPTNSDLPTFGTAAEANVQSSPSDATAGAVLNNETTHIGGNENWTAANIKAEDSLGLRVTRLMQNNSGATISTDQIVSGGDLKAVFFDMTVLTQSGTVISGTWKNTGGGNCSDGDTREFTKVSE